MNLNSYFISGNSKETCMQTEINFFIFSIIMVILFLSADARTIKDMAGRNVELPDSINHILPYDSRISIMLFPCAEHMLISKGKLPGKKQYAFISNEFMKLPESDINNLEEILSFEPEIIIAGCYGLEKSLEQYDRLQNRLHIPVVIIDMSIDKLHKTYDFIGNLLDRVSECEKFTHYLSSLYSQIDSLIIAKPLSGITAYYTLGAKGLMTDPSGSKHIEILDILKIPNAAKLAIPSGGHAKASMEQILLWAPDYIFAAGFKGEGNVYNHILSSPTWAQVPAVKNKQVFKVPGEPFGWFDHPPSVNRIPGMIWLCKLFYGLPSVQAQTQIMEFYKLFYRYDLNSHEYNKMVNGL